MSFPEIQAVIFDCDGTLVDSEPISQQVLIEMISEHGWEVSHDYAMEHWAGRDLHEILRLVEVQIERSLPVDFFKSFRTLQLERLRSDLQPIPGAADLLRTMKKPMCVASNAPLIKVRCCLETTGLIEFFEDKWLFSAYAVNAWKPQPDVFLHAAHQLGIAPEHCAVVEDSPCGIQAGIAAGMQVFAYTPQSPNTTTFSVRTVGRLSELADLL